MMILMSYSRIMDDYTDLFILIEASLKFYHDSIRKVKFMQVMGV